MMSAKVSSGIFSLTRLLPLAERIRELSVKQWSDRPPVALIGISTPIRQLLAKIEKFSRHSEPILVLGESGCGKELIARACYLLSDRVSRQFVPVSCPQYTDAGNTISELFGHKKGAFTGAVADRVGLFESADGGVIFLDEIADLPLQAQVMLLRTLAEGEFRRMGETQTRRVNTRVIAATHRPLNDLVVQKEFRHDLYFRLSYFPLHVPPLRERERDWLLIAEHLLEAHAAKYGVAKTLSNDVVRFLDSYAWPGNVRQLEAVITLGYSYAEDDVISLEDIQPALHWETTPEPSPAQKAAPAVIGNGNSNANAHTQQPRANSDASGSDEDEDDEAVSRLYHRIVEEGASFWDIIRGPFLDRELNRNQVRAVIRKGLYRCRGSYIHLLDHFHIPESEYHKFMGFLRTHSLKISVRTRTGGGA